MNNFKTTKIMVPIERIMPNRWNPNVQTNEIFRKGVESVKQLGMLGTILVRETGKDALDQMWYEILDGEHRWMYMKELEYTECPVENIGTITDQEAQFLTIHLNNLKGKDDIEKRAKILEALDEGQLQMLPFTMEEIENEKALFKFDFNKYDTKEKLEERVITRNFIVALTEHEYELMQRVLKIAEQEDNQSAIQWLMSQVKDYLDVHLGVNVETDDGTKEF